MKIITVTVNLMKLLISIICKNTNSLKLGLELRLGFMIVVAL